MEYFPGGGLILWTRGGSFFGKGEFFFLGWGHPCWSEIRPSCQAIKDGASEKKYRNVKMRRKKGEKKKKKRGTYLMFLKRSESSVQPGEIDTE